MKRSAQRLDLVRHIRAHLILRHVDERVEGILITSKGRQHVDGELTRCALPRDRAEQRGTCAERLAEQQVADRFEQVSR